MDECMEWLFECRKIFSKAKRYGIICQYAKIPDESLGRVKGSIRIKKSIDPESLLLDGKLKVKIKRKVEGDFVIEINENLKNISNPALRKQAVQYVIVHEILHIENKDMITLGKDYKRRKNKKIHKKEFKENVLEKFNMVRQTNGLPEIKSVEHMELAMHEILSRIKI